jgi:hypothetical protein
VGLQRAATFFVQKRTRKTPGDSGDTFPGAQAADFLLVKSLAFICNALRSLDPDLGAVYSANQRAGSHLEGKAHDSRSEHGLDFWLHLVH